MAAGLAIALLAATEAVLAGSGAAGGANADMSLGGPVPDGAAPDTFWDSTVVDIPGLSLTAVHCHGTVGYDLQLGATGPSHANPCYAALGVYSAGASELDTYLTLPGGQALYRASDDYGPWRYCIAGLITMDRAANRDGVSSPC